MLLGKCCPHGARGAAEPQTRSCRAPCANTRARKRTQARAPSPAGKRGGEGGGGIGDGDKGHVVGQMLAARRTRRGRAANTRVPPTLRQHASAQMHAGACAFMRTPCAADAGPPHTFLLPLPLDRFPSLPLSLSISRGAAARAQCAAAVLSTMRMLDDTRASEYGVCTRIRSSAHLLGEGITGCRKLSSVTFQAKTLSA